MGLFAFLRRKKVRSSRRAAQGVREEVGAPEVVAPATSWHHTLSSIALVRDPLGNTPGTHLEREFLLSILQSLALSISSQESSEEFGSANPASPFHALIGEIAAKAASEDLTLSHLEVVGLSFDEAMGYAARISAHSKKYTVLLGAHAAVGRASTPFHADISTFIAEHSSTAEEESENSKSLSLVLAVDGIAYAALIVRSDLR